MDIFPNIDVDNGAEWYDVYAIEAGEHSIFLSENTLGPVKVTGEFLPAPYIKAGQGHHAEIFNDDEDSTAYGGYAHAEGSSTTASGFAAHTEGSRTTASGFAAHAEGFQTTAYRDYSHAEGYKT